MQGYKKLLLTAGLVAFLIPVQGQNTDSPYSRYGYGVLNNQAVGVSRAMGGIIYGVRGLDANPGNPASYTSVDSLTFIFDMGVSYVKSRFSEGDNVQTDNNGGLDYISMQFRVAKKMGMSVGILPFSSVGYQFGTQETKNDVTTLKTFTGSGNFSQVYLGLAYEPIENLSVGGNVSFLFGNTKYTRDMSITSEPSSNFEYQFHKLTMNSLKFDLGAQYMIPLNKKDLLIIGAVLSPKVTTTGRIDRINNDAMTSDTIRFTGSDAYTDLPSTYGLGFTWNRDKRLTVGADVTFQNWSRARYSENMDDGMTQANRFNNVWRFNTGLEYSIDPRDRSFIKRVRFRGGLNYSNSYINVQNNLGEISGYKEYGATLGFGLPIRDIVYSGRTSYINIGLEYRSLNPEKTNLIKEQYFGISVGVCINELWFMKNKLR
ncbi:long-subunit fatty acid transport protein [Dysgonomonas alginatilytica]|uniref:Long-subunit fatty acid transport protein n=1 Tax=Dysgonomonas alginatilytica TaxID=1605892 RepID=A0A2V3PRG4_9BACT|nr:hypothetical protein [Dysgonomonas alginatilytica]PXV65121.1 long-subunit fatty acid transport protein [Dysgonomonas alginatilytica]